MQGHDLLYRFPGDVLIGKIEYFIEKHYYAA
jgi:hypothetical protein